MVAGRPGAVPRGEVVPRQGSHGRWLACARAAWQEAPGFRALLSAARVAWVETRGKRAFAAWLEPTRFRGHRPLPAREALSLADRQKLVRLRRKNRLQVARDNLAKATARFANRA